MSTISVPRMALVNCCSTRYLAGVSGGLGTSVKSVSARLPAHTVVFQGGAPD